MLKSPPIILMSMSLATATAAQPKPMGTTLALRRCADNHDEKPRV
jgi:hypothetical protein